MPQSEFKRSQRVGEQLQHELADLISNEIKDPRVGFVTVTEVRVTNDLRNATVYVSIYGTDAEREASIEGLQKAAGFLRRAISSRMQLRHTPELLFKGDNSLDRAERLNQLMSAIAHGDLETPEAVSHEVVPVKTPRSELAERERQFAEAEKARQARHSRKPRRRR